MATYNDIIDTTAFVNTNPIAEPLLTPPVFTNFLKRFDPDIYNTGVSSHLYKFLLALVGDAGAGILNKQISFARFQSRLETTYFTDLDRLYDNVLGLPRLAEERYVTNDIDGSPLDPRSQAITPNQWEDILLKDAAYRSRCLAWAQALLLGGTPEGLAFAAQAALNAECFVFENYKYLDSTYNGDNSQPNLANSSNNRKQFVIVPQLPQSEVTPEKQFYLYRLLNRIKPVGTFFTINYSANPRTQILTRGTDSSSNYFYVTRLVTGNNDVNWPALDASNAYWIQSGESNPAPSFAFLQRQEYSTIFTLAGVTADEYHQGPFNKEQQAFFPQLRNNDSPPVNYLPQFSYSVANTPLYSTNPWMNGYNQIDSPLLINNYYPLNYFNISNTQLASNSPTRFWATDEKDQGEQDYLIFDLGTIRQVNFIDFEICQKPITLGFSYSSDNITWTDATFAAEFSNTTNEIQFLPSENNPWFQYEAHFDTFEARYLKVTFTRREVMIFPQTNTSFKWSIEVKNTRIGHQINNTADILTDSNGDFIPITGTDILNNQYTTEVTQYLPDNVVDSSSSTFWQSQPNPSPQAVENLYFDLRLSSSVVPGTQTVLDLKDEESLDVLDQQNIELFYEDGQIVSELYIDPLTVGPYMHFYWSNDDLADWDQKLWNPINKHYVLKRGYYYLPRPIKCKYFKIEFSNLIPIPYNTLEYPQTPNIKYKKFPSWVQDMFMTMFPATLNNENLFYPYNSLRLNEENVGLIRTPTIFDESDQLPPASSNIILNEVQDAQNSLLTSSTRTIVQSQTRQNIGDNITIVNSTMFKDPLSNLNLSNPINRFVYNSITTTNSSNTVINNEQGNPQFDAPINQSVLNLDQEEKNKKMPIMWFPFTARHAYQELEVQRSNKIAYIVGVRTVDFYRRDYSTKYDESFYNETFGDTTNILQNDFTLNDWNYTVD